MIIILAEDYRYPLGSIIDLLKGEFPPSSITTMSRFNHETVLEKIAIPPVLTSAWLVFVRMYKFSEDLLQEFSKSNNLYILQVRTKTESQELSLSLQAIGAEFKTMNNLKPKKELIIEYIIKELGITDKLAELLFQICRGRPSKIYEAVEILRGGDTLTAAQIRRYIKPVSEHGLESVLGFIMGYSRSISFAEASKVIRSYRNAISYVMGFLLKRFEITQALYYEISEGSVSLENCGEYFATHRKDLKYCQEWNIQVIVEEYSNLSFDKLYLLKTLYESIRDTHSPVELLSVMRMSK